MTSAVVCSSEGWNLQVTFGDGTDNPLIIAEICKKKKKKRCGIGPWGVLNVMISPSTSALNPLRTLGAFVCVFCSDFRVDFVLCLEPYMI